MDNKEYIKVINELKEYIKIVKNDFFISQIILFGSYAKGTATMDSDVDIALISKEFGKIPLLEKMKLFELRSELHLIHEIQPVPFSIDDFNEESDFFIQEIKKTGKDITKEVM